MVLEAENLELQHQLEVAKIVPPQSRMEMVLARNNSAADCFHNESWEGKKNHIGEAFLSKVFLCCPHYYRFELLLLLRIHSGPNKRISMPIIHITT